MKIIINDYENKVKSIFTSLESDVKIRTMEKNDSNGTEVYKTILIYYSYIVIFSNILWNILTA